MGKVQFFKLEIGCVYYLYCTFVECVLPDDTYCSVGKMITPRRPNPKQRAGSNSTTQPGLEPTTSRVVVLLFATELSPPKGLHHASHDPWDRKKNNTMCNFLYQRKAHRSYKNVGFIPTVFVKWCFPDYWPLTSFYSTFSSHLYYIARARITRK